MKIYQVMARSRPTTERGGWEVPTVPSLRQWQLGATPTQPRAVRGRSPQRVPGTESPKPETGVKTSRVWTSPMALDRPRELEEFSISMLGLGVTGARARRGYKVDIKGLAITVDFIGSRRLVWMPTVKEATFDQNVLRITARTRDKALGAAEVVVRWGGRNLALAVAAPVLEPLHPCTPVRLLAAAARAELARRWEARPPKLARESMAPGARPARPRAPTVTIYRQALRLRGGTRDGRRTARLAPRMGHRA